MRRRESRNAPHQLSAARHPIPYLAGGPHAEESAQVVVNAIAPHVEAVAEVGRLQAGGLSGDGIEDAPRCAMCMALCSKQRNVPCMAVGRRRSPTLAPRPALAKLGDPPQMPPRKATQASPACLDVHRLSGGQQAPHNLLVAGGVGAVACGLHHEAAVRL